MKIWVISDTHETHGLLKVPEGVDMVICGGDVANNCSPHLNLNPYLDFLEWYSSLDIEYKIFIAGNHDTSMEKGLIETIPDDLIYLEHESVEIEGIQIFGSPFTPTFGTGWAYNVDDEDIGIYWDVIPNDTDILITHGPPKTILDVSYGGINCGCGHLLKKVLDVHPKFHIFGHIHEDGGKDYKFHDVTFINAAVVDLYHKQVNNGHIIEI